MAYGPDQYLCGWNPAVMFVRPAYVKLLPSPKILVTDIDELLYSVTKGDAR
jgi:hypothetical protein